MIEPTNPREARRLLEAHSLSPKKSFGQNFLINPAIPERIADEAARELSGEHGVIEVGPGIGALTVRLADRFDRVAAIELDASILAPLAEVLEGCDNVEVINADVMKTDIRALIAEKFGGMPVSVCANLPYYITTPVIMHLLEAGGVERITLMIQAEVADRLAAREGSAEYGAITAAVALRASVRKCFDVAPGNFLPPPKVTSTVIQLTPHKNGIRDVCADIGECDPDKLLAETSRVIAAAFAMRRKTLVNSLSTAFPKDKAARAIAELGFAPDIRGERLSAADFIKLTVKLKKDLLSL